MVDTPGVKLRLDPVAQHDLEQLARKLNITRSDVVRMALRRLAEAEGIARKDAE